MNDDVDDGCDVFSFLCVMATCVYRQATEKRGRRYGA